MSSSHPTDDRQSAAVSVAGDADGVAVPPATARALNLASGDWIAITTETADRTVFRLSIDATVDPGVARVSESTAESLGVVDGDQVTLAPADETPASRVTVAPVADLSVRGSSDAVAEVLADRSLTTGETVSVSLLGGTLELPFRVVETTPTGVVTVGPETEVTVESGPADSGGRHTSDPVPTAAVGGYETTLDACRRALVAPLVEESAYEFGGVSAAAGVLVEGQSGVGKSHLVGHAAWLADATLLRVDGSRLARDGREAAADYLDRVAARTRGADRVLVVVDDLDALAADGDSAAARDLGRWLGDLRTRPGVVVAGETTDAEALPASLTRGDRLGRRLHVPRPTAEDLAAIFRTLTRGLEFAPSVDPETVGRRALGYVAADLVALRARLVEAALARSGEATGLVVTEADVETALSETTPRAASAVETSIPSVSFDDIGGLEDAKRELTRAVEWPLVHGDILAELGIDVPGGILLHGPPGTGKTMLARAVASNTDANFLVVNGPELFDKFVGESERAVRQVFERARASAPAVIFFDELDALGAVRGDDGSAAPERVVSQLLTELDGLRVREGVTVIGATNRRDRIDEALLRPGRFDRSVAVPLPDREARIEILHIHARNTPITGLDAEALADRTDGYSGSDLSALLREASLLALEDHLESSDGSPEAAADAVSVASGHVERALERVSPSTGAGGHSAPSGASR